jgi:succinylarginine dihydrolase
MKRFMRRLKGFRLHIRFFAKILRPQDGRPVALFSAIPFVKALADVNEHARLAKVYAVFACNFFVHGITVLGSNQRLYTSSGFPGGLCRRAPGLP